MKKMDGAKVRANASGGSAAAGGMNFHARVAAVAAVHLLGHRRLGWLKEMEVDIPVDIWCETNGPGDDLRIVLANNLVIEAQVKKGLKRGEDLWIALDSLAAGIHMGAITYGVLVIDIDASMTIRRGLAQGIVRLGEGRADFIDEITEQFVSRLDQAKLPVQDVCRKLRIVVMHCADRDDASEGVAKDVLQRLCADAHNVENAWTAIQLSAHGLIERKGRWRARELSGVLKTANIELQAIPDQGELLTICGRVWENLDEANQYQGFIQSFRQHYLVSDQMTAQPFGGRDSECQQLDAWLSDTKAPSRKLISAPTARGKSALLVQWTESLASDTTWAVIFVPISLRFGTDRSVVFYALLATQLASVMQTKLAPPASDSDEFYRAASIRLMNQAVGESRHILIVLDGLDEAQGAGFNSTVFPPNLPPTIKILVSAREQAGDRGPEGWLKRLDWQANMADSGGLSILAHEAVIPILESVGIDKNDVCDKLVERLIFLSAGEPLLLGLYATDLSDIARREGKISVRSLEGLSPGFTSYFSRAFDTQSLSENGDALEMTLAVLAMALGPLEGPHLTTLTCNLCNISRPIVSDRFIKPLKRFIAGDGRPGHGYVLNHPKLAEYMLEERFGLDTQQLVENAFLAWGRDVAKTLETTPNLPAPAYVLLHHVDHLRRAGAGSLYDIDLLLTEGWKQAWFNFDNDYTGYADSLLSASAIIQACATYHDDAIRALRLRIKIGLFSGSVRSQGINVPSELLAMALKDQLVTLRQALNIVELQLPNDQLNYLLAIAQNLPHTYLERVLSDIYQTTNLNTRNGQLAILAAHLPQPQRGEVVKQVLRWLFETDDSQLHVSTITALAPELDDAQLDRALERMMSDELKGQDLLSLIISLLPIIEALPQSKRPKSTERFINQCLVLVDTSTDYCQMATALRYIAPLIDEDRLTNQAARLKQKIELLKQNLPMNASWNFETQFQYEKIIKASVTLDILTSFNSPKENYLSSLMTVLTPLLVSDFWRIDTLTGILPLIQTETRQHVVSLAHKLALKLPSANNRTYALMEVARSALPATRKPIITDALFNARRIEDEYTRCRTLISLFSTLPSTDKESEKTKLLGDIQKITYSLHFGELLLQLSSNITDTVELADQGIQAICLAQDIPNKISTILREINNVPLINRKAIFQYCWQLISDTSNKAPEFHFGMAARYATDLWTIKEFEEVRRKLVNIRPDFRAQILSELLIVGMRLGAQELLDEVFDEIVEQEDPNTSLYLMIENLKHLNSSDPRRDLLRHYWSLSVASENPHFNVLINGFSLLEPRDQALEWQKLKALAKSTSEPAQFFASLSLISKTQLERVELLETAFSECAAETAERRIPQAVQIVSACKTTGEIWRALDLMTSFPSVSRNTVMSTLQHAAPALTEVGTASFIKALMADIRESADWWP